MYYVYVLRSKRDGKLYIGKTRDLRIRFRQHQSGVVIATRNRRPMELLYYEGFTNKTDCGREELFLKCGVGENHLNIGWKKTYTSISNDVVASNGDPPRLGGSPDMATRR